MSDIAQQTNLEMRARYERFLRSLGAAGGPLAGCRFQLASAGDGHFFVTVTRETTIEEAALELSFSGPAVQINVQSEQEFKALEGTELPFPDHSYAVTFGLKKNEPGKEDTTTTYDYSYCVAAAVSTFRFVSIDSTEVRIEVELLLQGELSSYGTISGYEISEDTEPQPDQAPKNQPVKLEASCSYLEVHDALDNYFRTLSPPAEFPVEKLSIEWVDKLGLLAAPVEQEIMFNEYSLGGQTMHPNFLIDEPFGLGVSSVKELEGRRYSFDRTARTSPWGRIFNLYPRGSPYACVTTLSFGRITDGHIECVFEIHLSLAEIAKHNPSHRYNDTTCILKTKISVSEGFVV